MTPLAVVALLVASNGATELRAEARALVAAAKSAFDEGRFSEAAERFAEAHRVLVDSDLEAPPALLFNAGLAYERAGMCVAVAEFFGRFIEEDPDAAARGTLGSRLDAARRCAPLIRIETQPPGADVTIDGVHRGKTPGAWRITSGTHSIRLHRDGWGAVDSTFSVNAGEPRTIQFPLTRATTPKVAVAVAVSADAMLFVDDALVCASTCAGVHRVAAGLRRLRIEKAGCESTEFLHRAQLDDDAGLIHLPEPTCPQLAEALTASAPPPALSTWAWAGGGVGVASLAASAVLFALEASAMSDAEGLVGNGDPFDERAMTNQAERYAVGARACLGAGLGGLVTAGVLWLVDANRETTERAEAVAVR